MEGRRIMLLGNFALISIVMPYYEPTHRSFILLSSLWKKSRDKLDEFYDEFINLMKNYWYLISVDLFTNHQRLQLPSNLFILNFIEIKQNIDYFINFINNIKSKIGYYFNNHYMHDKLMIFSDKILIDLSQLELLYPYWETLKSLKAFWNFSFNNKSQKKYLNLTLLDTKLNLKNGFKFNQKSK